MAPNALSIAILALGLLIALGFFLRLRREHAQAFNELPTGVCAVGPDRIEHWNRVMTALTGISRADALGLHPRDLPEPWSDALLEVLNEPSGTVIKRSLESDAERPRWVMLHSSAAKGSGRSRMIMIEDITDYQQMQDELLHRERLASIGRLAAGVAHEIGNPVTGIACVAQNLKEEPTPVEVEQSATEILKQTQRVSRTLSALMQLSHPGSSERDTELRACNLADCIDEAIHLLRLDLRAADCHFDNRCDRELLVAADNQLLLQVFLNLLDNARSASAGDEPITIDARESDSGHTVIITIDNPGPRIKTSILREAFEPFFTTKDVGEGTGLGLALVRRMLEDMRGGVRLQSPSPRYKDGGTRAEVHLKRAHYDPAYTEQPQTRVVS